jgi:hypothetical protein
MITDVVIVVLLLDVWLESEGSGAESDLDSDSEAVEETEGLFVAAGDVVMGPVPGNVVLDDMDDGESVGV